jgi:hypothetical protein
VVRLVSSFVGITVRERAGCCGMFASLLVCVCVCAGLRARTLACVVLREVEGNRMQCTE